MISFLRLVRFTNLLIVAATIIGVVALHSKINNVKMTEFLNINFFLFVISTLLITAAGNIINDYFDIKADKVNKPNRLIVSKNIKRRWAIVLHFTFNLTAFLISLYLSIILKNVLLSILPFVAINLLWFYSLYLKKKLIVGNISIALLTALVPILTAIYLDIISPYNRQELIIIYLLSAFAFLQNLIREIIKDTEDVEGDKLIHVKSIPIYFGKKNTKIICLFLLLILPVTILINIFMFDSINQTVNYLFGFFPILVSGTINIFLIALILIHNFQKLRLYNNLIKIGLISGITTFYFISFT
jgi:4-hydroxybenzoate polyprenyltransferase